MVGMFERKNASPEVIRDLKNKITKKLNLPESTILSIAELHCHEPNCPPKETVITTRSIDGSVKNWRLAKSINEIGIEDLENCLLYTSPSPRDATLSRMPSSA